MQNLPFRNLRHSESQSTPGPRGFSSDKGLSIYTGLCGRNMRAKRGEVTAYGGRQRGPRAPILRRPNRNMRSVSWREQLLRNCAVHMWSHVDVPVREDWGNPDLPAGDSTQPRLQCQQDNEITITLLQVFLAPPFYFKNYDKLNCGCVFSPTFI